MIQDLEKSTVDLNQVVREFIQSTIKCDEVQYMSQQRSIIHTADTRQITDDFSQNDLQTMLNIHVQEINKLSPNACSFVRFPMIRITDFDGVKVTRKLSSAILLN